MEDQLLGESMIQQKSDLFKHFTSIIFFPEGNQHFINATNGYISLLKINNKFIPVKYEDYFQILKAYSKEPRYNKWINYLQARYIVSHPELK